MQATEQKKIPLKKAIIIIIVVSIALNLILGSITFGILRVTRPRVDTTDWVAITHRMANNTVRIEVRGLAGGTRDGSGVIVEIERDPYGGDDAYYAIIITCYHVVSGQGRIYVALNNEEFRMASVIGRDVGTDVAILRTMFRVEPNFALTLSGDSDRRLEWGRDSELRVGQPVVSLGNALGGGTISHQGTIGQIGVTQAINFGNVTRELEVIRVTSNIQRGMSGGPTIDANGRLVGINVGHLIATDEYIGFLISAGTAREVFERAMG